MTQLLQGSNFIGDVPFVRGMKIGTTPSGGPSMIRLIAVLFFFLLLMPVAVRAQEGSEIGVFGGVSNYIGDLNPYRPFYNPKPGGGVFWRKILNKRYAIKTGFNYGTVEAFDRDGLSLEQRMRNLDFHTRLYELTSQIEFNFLPYELNNPKYPFSPYIFAGLSAFHFNPHGNLNGELIALRPLATEGQGTSWAPGKRPYRLIQGAFAFGAGLKLAVAGRLGIGLEWGLRKTTTDHLDDVSGTYPNLYGLASERGALAAAMSDRSLNGTEFGLNSGRQRGNSRKND
jgi:hypothetical protein